MRGDKIPEEQVEQRRKMLYGFLLSRGDQWTKMRDVTRAIVLYPPLYTGNYHNSGARRLLTGDIKHINNSSEFEKIIISGDRGIKLANERECVKFMKAEYREVFRKLKQVRRIGTKVLKDQQMDFEGRIYETFMDETFRDPEREQA